MARPESRQSRKLVIKIIKLIKLTKFGLNFVEITNTGHQTRQTRRNSSAKSSKSPKSPKQQDLPNDCHFYFRDFTLDALAGIWLQGFLLLPPVDRAEIQVKSLEINL
jgi:hypothetical protein